jgi:RNA polymerase sigma factor (sigma-70 family)
MATARTEAARFLAADLPDEQLLDWFARSGDEAAFAALVRRHAPRVLGVCRRVLGDEHAAEDCCQAVFLVLAQKAHCLRRAGPLGPWLCAVAVRTALKARAQGQRRRRRERQAALPEAVTDPADPARRDLRAALEEALASLPDTYRVPLALHYLEGDTVAEVARALGCPEGTAAARLARGRQRLRARLAGRGVGWLAVLVAMAKGGLNAMGATGLKGVACVLLGLGLLAGSAVAWRPFGGKRGIRQAAVRAAPPPPQAGLAFGAWAGEARQAAIRLELRGQGLLLAANELTIEKDGRVRFAPCWIARSGGTVARCRAATLTLDWKGPLREIGDLGRRRILAIHLEHGAVRDKDGTRTDFEERVWNLPSSR